MLLAHSCRSASALRIAPSVTKIASSRHSSSAMRSSYSVWQVSNLSDCSRSLFLREASSSSHSLRASRISRMSSIRRSSAALSSASSDRSVSSSLLSSLLVLSCFCSRSLASCSSFSSSCAFSVSSFPLSCCSRTNSCSSRSTSSLAAASSSFSDCSAAICSRSPRASAASRSSISFSFCSVSIFSSSSRTVSIASADPAAFSLSNFAMRSFISNRASFAPSARVVSFCSCSSSFATSDSSSIFLMLSLCTSFALSTASSASFALACRALCDAFRASSVLCSLRSSSSTRFCISVDLFADTWSSASCTVTSARCWAAAASCSWSWESSDDASSAFASRAAVRSLMTFFSPSCSSGFTELSLSATTSSSSCVIFPCAASRDMVSSADLSAYSVIFLSSSEMVLPRSACSSSRLVCLACRVSRAFTPFFFSLSRASYFFRSDCFSISSRCSEACSPIISAHAASSSSFAFCVSALYDATTASLPFSRIAWRSIRSCWSSSFASADPTTRLFSSSTRCFHISTSPSSFSIVAACSSWSMVRLCTS
eukprot:Sspe_Gene.80107::Locus_50406_Transcript_1_1_Confidence_1.000_Length_1882::g.80107::m.80107